MSERFCPYCQNFKPDDGFTTIVHVKSGSKRGMCPSCRAIRKRPRLDLINEAENAKQARKKK
jgi:hypothetical protein